MTATRFYTGSVEPLSELEVSVIASTPQLARDGHIILASGIDLTAYRKNPIVLWSHDAMSPVGICTAIGVVDDKLAARIRFADVGVSQRADEVRALVKSGVIRGISIGFDPKESTPLDPARPRGGQRFTRVELLECSFVSVPSDIGASVTARHYARTARDLAMLAALPATPCAALQRAAAKFASGRSDGRLVSHASQVYLLLKTNEERRGHDYTSRQREIARLRQIGRRNAN
jgi:Escherichia/Staphylococcus phage prohead protease